MYTKEEWLLGSLAVIALLGFALVFGTALDRYNTSQTTTVALQPAPR
jgi:hypothetical protein